jgi:predicted TIM-barrel fold metal-dependent hydrolase
MLNYKLISCDDHLDLNMLPADLWIERVPADLIERAPHVVEKDGRAIWVCDGENWGSWAGKAGPAGPKPVYTALDRGGIVDQTERRPGVAELRLEDMDRDGVYTHVIFGPVTSIRHKDPVLRDLFYSIYNDWLADFCQAAPDRLIGVGLLPPHPEAALAEVRRLIAKGGFKQANLQIATVEPKISDARWEPLLVEMEKAGMILSFHVTVFASVQKAFDPLEGSPGASLGHAKMFVEQFLEPFVDLFSFGILERHPKLKIVIAEAGAGWLPWIVEELDYRFWRMWEAKEFWAKRGGIPLVTKPSELFRRQVYTTFQQSDVTVALTQFYGDNLLWATDYPHPDSIWPNSRRVAEEMMGHLPPETMRKITRDNAARLYGIEETSSSLEGAIAQASP